MSEEPETDREALEREAERVRARLYDTLDVLDKRRHDVLDVKHQVEQHVVPVAAGGAIFFVGIGGVIALAVHHAIDSRRHRGRERMRAFTRIWRHPERAAKYQPRSILAEVGRKALLAAASMVAVEITKRALRKVMVARDAREARALPA